MRTATISLALTLAIAALTGSLMAKPVPGDIDPPQNLTVTYRSGYVVFTWEPVEGATKYSLCTKGIVTWSDGTQRYQTCIKQDFGTQDDIGMTGEITDGDGNVTGVYLAIPETAFVRLALAAIEAEGVDRATVVGLKVDGAAKVKGLNPGKGMGRQNNLFSEPATFEVTWVR